MVTDEQMITVTVRLHSILRHRDNQIVDKIELTLPDGSLVQDVLDTLAIDPQLEPLLAIGSDLASADTALRQGDKLAIIPSVSGGSS